MIVCNDLKDDEDIMRHLRNFYANSNSIIRKCHHCSISVKLYLFHAYCCTIYGSQLWVNINKGTHLKAKVAYNNMYRQILNIADGTVRVACLLINKQSIHLSPNA